MPHAVHLPPEEVAEGQLDGERRALIRHRGTTPTNYEGAEDDLGESSAAEMPENSIPIKHLVRKLRIQVNTIISAI